MSKSFNETWVSAKKEETLAILDGLFNTVACLRGLPADGQEAHKMVAVDGLDALLPIAAQLAPADLTKDQWYAAMLIGRGLTMEEAGVALDLPEAKTLVHLWMGQTSFRRLVRHWRRSTMEDQIALVYRELDEIEQGASAGIMVKIARLRYEISQAPAERDLKEAALQLKLREVVAREREVAHEVGEPEMRPPWMDDVRDFQSGNMLDAEFVVVDPTEDEEEYEKQTCETL